MRTWSGALIAAWPSLLPVGVVAVLFKLAISDGGRHPASLALAQVLIFAMLAVLVWTGRAHAEGIGRPMLLLLSVMVLSSLASVRPEASVRELLLWTMYLGITVITASTLTVTASARRMLDAVVAIGGWLVLIALFMFWGANNPGMRWYSTYYWANPFASSLLLLIPLEVIRYVTASSPRATFAHGMAALFLGAALVLTYSRGAWISLFVTVPVLIVVLRPVSWGPVIRRGLFLGVLIVLVVTALTRGTAWMMSGQSVAARAATVADPGDDSIQGRLHFWRAGVEIFRGHLLVGTGPGTFGAVHARYQRDVRYYARDPHNLYIEAAAEMGSAGLLALAVLVGAVVVLWVRALRESRGHHDYPLVVGIGGGVVAFFIHSGVEMTWMFPAAPAMAWTLVGVLAWYAHRAVTSARVQAGSMSWTRLPAAIGLVLVIGTTLAFQKAHESFVAGQALARRGEWRDAAAAYARAARFNPLSATYLAAYGAAAQDLPEHRRTAVSAFRRAMVLDSWNPSHTFRLARLLLRSAGGEAEAETLLKQAITMDRFNRPEISRQLARLYLQQGRTADADRVYREATSLYVGRGLGQASQIYLLLWPEVIGLFLDASEASARRGDLTQAAEFLEVLLREDPIAVVAGLRLSDIYVKMGRSTDARVLLIELRERVPDNADLHAALSALETK